ncbi:MAG: cell envelope integrity EipB family protein [Alphaproteobacteria bacterium]|nr:cell envelope integrity EipB family protein [Alphaproteobacteria bacterium]
MAGSLFPRCAGRVFWGLVCALSLLGGGAVLAGPLSGPVLDPATAVGLVPHKAIYDVRLSSAKTGSQVLDIRGKMLFEWKPSCEGWITDHRFTLVYDYADTPAMTIDSDFSTFEGFDRQSLNFSSRRSKDGEVYEELRGKANLDPVKGKGVALYSLPEGVSFDLDKAMLFPTGHTIDLLAAAKGGNRFMRGVVFDGSDEVGPVEINSFIGKKIPSGLSTVSTVAAAKIDKSLIGVPGWAVRMAFFPNADTGALSDYELTMDFLENGIISDMKIDYADFSVSQKLVALEKIKSDLCRE